MSFKTHLDKLSKNWTKLVNSVINFTDKAVKYILFALVYFYRSCLSMMMGGGCRFEPTCSQYALEAIETYSFPKALYYIIKRLLNCRPGGPFGYDPLPKNELKNKHRGCCS